MPQIVISGYLLDDKVADSAQGIVNLAGPFGRWVIDGLIPWGEAGLVGSAALLYKGFPLSGRDHQPLRMAISLVSAQLPRG